jgi:molecular chaperone DnaK (HSP70)
LNLFDQRFIVGIDLGTTNSAVSYVDLAEDPVDSSSSERTKSRNRIRIFHVPQLTEAGEVNPLPVLPSFLYIPGKYDLSGDAVQLPWQTTDAYFAGAFARDHGAGVPARLVSSAKSWLCHNNVDRRARILPWGSGEDVRKISPVDATAAYLDHIRKAWNRIRGEEEDLYLENQMVILTVPASFDEVARDLTLESAKAAGLPNVTLLEEPLAAFYSWLMRHEHNWNEDVRPDDLILVCDVGGGTTDFTLITLREVEGSPRFERIAVGDHLILGGDNIDLALSRKAEAGFGGKCKTLSSERWKALCHQCRQAKENILDKGSDAERITLMGEGGKLIAGTLSTTLSREDIETIVLDGFFPLVKADAFKTSRKDRKGIAEFGLPYEQEPAITRHLGWFLERHKEDVKRLLHKQPVPDLILFNGGSLKPAIIQERIRQAIRYWFDMKDETLPRVLENNRPDLAVALGASYYGLVKTGIGVRVGSGSPRSYYLGIATGAAGEQTSDGVGTGTSHTKKAVCLVERGLDEGSKIELTDKKFEVRANRQVSFDVYSSSFRSGDRCGDVVSIDDSMTALPPIQTIVKFGKKGREMNIPVQIEAEYTELGTLSLWCRSLMSDHRWQLQFQLRATAPETSATSKLAVAEKEVFDEAVVREVNRLVRFAFEKKERTDREVCQPSETAVSLNNLVRRMAEVTERSREQWPLGLIRSVADELLKMVGLRKQSSEHESRWLNLLGFCLRPGFGDGFDEHRIQLLWKIYRGGPIFPKNAQVAAEWWILWRRVAGGLKPGHQRQIIQDLTPLMMTKKGSKVRIPQQERTEIWLALANMEKLLVKDKIKWGDLLLTELHPKKIRPPLLWAFSRIGARELLYGSSDRVVPPDKVAVWIDKLLSIHWRNPQPVAQALVQLARKTGDRARDIEPEQMERIIEWIHQNDLNGSYIRYLQKVIPISGKEQTTVFGESLPSGLVMHA